MADLDIGSLLGTDVSKKITDDVLNSLLLSMEDLQSSTTVKGTGDIFNCAISLGDFDFDLNLDLFNMTPTKMDYILLKKIQYLRRLITDINNIFINLIKDLDCCTGDDRYNKTVVPIFKWLVEDSNGLCGSLLKIAKDLNKIYLPLKRILCLFKIVPGNPTLGMGGTDIYKYVYPIVDGLEKVMNMLDNGRFLDLLIIPIKDFHDKLVACSNGKDADFYTGYHSLKDIISDSIYTELTANFIDSIKAIQQETTSEGLDLPTPPTPPNINFKDAPKLNAFNSYAEYSTALYQWNIEYSNYKKVSERQYDQEYADYLKALEDYRQNKFEKTLTLTDQRFENATLSAELMVDDFKNKHRSICGCLGEIFRLDGLFIPKDFIIRSEADLKKLIGEVKYKGISISNYYTDQEKTKIEIINNGSINAIRNDPKASSFTESMKHPIVKSEYLSSIDATKTVQDIINLNTQFNNKLDTLKTKFRKQSNYYDSLNSSFYSLYQKELSEMRTFINRSQISNSDPSIYETMRRRLYEYTEYPPAQWLNEDKTLSSDQQQIFGNVSYLEMVQGTEDTLKIQTEIDELNEAIGRNYTVVSIVDNASIECGCDLLCMIVKYIINLIMQVVKLLLQYITKYLASALANKELMWWIKFIQSKIQCIVDLANLSKDLKTMENKFKQEMENAKGSIQSMPESLTSCNTSKSSVIDEINLYPLKSHIKPDSIPDITWVPDIYPEFNNPDYNVTPTLDNSFDFKTKNVTYLTNNWKNRTIPSTILDCRVNHQVDVNWVPQTNSWKMFLNIKLNMEQFDSDHYITLDGNPTITDSQIIEDSNKTIIYKIMSIIPGNENFRFKIDYNSEIIEFLNGAIDSSVTSDYFINDRIYGLNDIDKVWFYVDDQYYKVFDKNTETNLKNYIESTRLLVENTVENLKQKATEFETPEATNNKICSASSLTITTFEPVYNDPALGLYPGGITKFVNTTTNEVNFTYTPRIFDIIETDSDGIEIIRHENFTKNNTPFKLVLTNGSGIKFTVILLIDICIPTNVVKVSYSREVDGVFLNGRYDYFEFDAIPNDSSYIVTEKNIIKKLRGYLENIGAISDSVVGPININTQSGAYNELIDNSVDDDIYSEGFDTDQDTSNSTKVIENLPNDIKNNIAMFTKLYEVYTDTINYLDVLKENIESYDTGINNDIKKPDEILIKSPSKIGIPLAVLNESENIILTIHNKQLKLININNNFNLNLPLETGIIDYREGEQLFIEYSTTGFDHTISWTNERKISGSATVMATNSIQLKPTQIGSVYKDGNKIALMCGTLLDLIFTESPNTKDDWMNNSNTYRPAGTIGYYDFSVFDGYHVYSIPEFFKVTKLGNLATTKGILYESKEYTREEILIKIQNNEFNSLLSTEVVVVGERPISVGGDFIWKNKTYYKNVTFGYLDNFFCRDNLSETSFSISFWLKMKDAISNERENFTKKYIFSDTHNGNFIWLEDNLLKIQLYGQPLRIEPVFLIFEKDMNVLNPEYIEKWFHHTFRYDKAKANVYYTIEAINQDRNFDINYDNNILNKIEIKIPLISTSIGKKIKFSLVTMLARYDVKKLIYTDLFPAEIAALAIWREYKDHDFINSIYDYQKRIIINEMEN